MQVQVCSDRADFLLRMRATPQLTSLSDFQGPTAAHSVRQKKRACQSSRCAKEEVASSPPAGAALRRPR